MSDSKDIEDIYPLSPMQQGMLFHTLYAAQTEVYCVQWYGTFHGYLDVCALQQAWQSLLARHTVLRTAFHWELRDEPFQVVYRHTDLLWQEYDWRHLPATEQEQQLDALLQEDRRQGFALSTAPLMRLRLLQLTADTYQLLWSMPHLLLDGWSLRLLLQEVSQLYHAFYTGRQVNQEVSRPYGDYIGWLQQQDLSQAKNFWQHTLKGFTTPTVIACRPQPHHSAATETAYAEQQLQLTNATTTALQQLAHDQHLSVNTLVQGAWAMLLGRYSGQDDILFGATVAGRPPDLAGVESMVGLFINTLPVRVQLPPEAWLLPWLEALQSQQVEARQYDYSPLVHVQGWSDVPRGVPLFESLLVFENYPTRTSRQEWGNGLEIRHSRLLSHTHYPLTVVAVPDTEFVLRIGYQTDRFDAATIVRMLGHLRTLLEGMIAHPYQRLADLPMLTAAERQQLLVEWNDTSAAYPQELCIQQWFEAQVARVPEAVAVVYEEAQLTYRELNLRANQLGHALQTRGVGPDVLVGLCVERSLALVVGLLGVLKAGGAYVPLDPAYPQERLDFLLQDTQAPVLLTQQHLAEKFAGRQVQVICLDTDWYELAQADTTNTASAVTPDHLVYVTYTSGSTSIPKGVAITHRQLSHYLHGVQQRLALPPAASFASVSSVAADLGNTMIYGALCTGGCLHILSQERVTDPDAMTMYFTRHAIDCLKIVPSHLAALHASSHSEHVFPRRLLILGGEASRPEWVQHLHEMAPDCAILNHYGPTEATVGVLTYRLEAHQPLSETGVFPLGRPLANVEIYLLDHHLQPVPVGIPGELYIGGASLARGYLKQPGLTAEKFLPHPFSQKPGTRLYKTGDLAYYLPDGNIAFLGRLDHQVKIRGYRVELGEIETTLEQHQTIRQAVVLAWQDNTSDRHLVAYCVPHDECSPDLLELHHFLQAKLPDSMLPTDFVVLDALPLTANGKVDRQALPAPTQRRSPLLDTFVAARTPMEELLVGIWMHVLKLPAIGIQDNFFALGGHSLLAMQVMSRLRKVFQVELPLRTLFDTPTVAGLARQLTLVRGTAHSTSPPPFRPVPRQHAVPLTMTQQHLWVLDRLLPGAPFSNMPYVVRLTGRLDVTALEHSYNAIIERHDMLRTTFITIAGEPMQVSVSTLHVPLLFNDLRTLPAAERNAQVQQLISYEALYFFDLEKGPLLRVRLLQLGEQEHIFLLTVHHIMSDGWSWGVFLHEFTLLYDAFTRSDPSPLPPLPMQYADYAQWQEQWLHSTAGNDQLAYWLQQLRPPLTLLALPTDRPSSDTTSLRTARQSFQLSQEFTMALTQLSRQEDATLFITLLAAFKTLLSHSTGQEDIRVGTLVANRQHQDTEGLIGLFANLVVLRTTLTNNPSLRQILRRVRTTTLDAYTHQELPFEHLARTFVRTQQDNRQALFQVMFILQNARQHTLQLADLTIESLAAPPIGISACDLVVSLGETSEGLEGVCIYKTTLFDDATITQFLADYDQILTQFVTQPALRLSQSYNTYRKV